MGFLIRFLHVVVRLQIARSRSYLHTLGPKVGITYMGGYQMMVPCLVLSRIRHLVFRRPEGQHDFDNHLVTYLDPLGTGRAQDIELGVEPDKVRGMVAREAIL